MEVDPAPAVAKRMWSYLRAVFFMMRKGVLSKRKLLLSMHLVMKRRNKAVARSVANLLSHYHHHHSSSSSSHALRRGEYEFSCSNSPDRAGNSFSYGRGGGSWTASPAPSSPGLLLQELAPGEECTPACSPLVPTTGGFSVRVSNYSSEEEDGDLERGSEAVDDEAEEFIGRFYEQLRRQNSRTSCRNPPCDDDVDDMARPWRPSGQSGDRPTFA